MTTVQNNLSKAKLGQMLDAAKRNRPVKEANSDAPKYNWYQARHFSNSQMQKLEAFGSKLGNLICGGIEKLGNGIKFGAAEIKVNQKFYKDLEGKLGEAKQYFAGIKSGNNVCGAVVITAKSGTNILAKLLGDNEPAADANRVLLPLEKTMLQEVFTAAVSSLKSCSKEFGGPDFAAVSEYSNEKPDLEKYKDEEFCEAAVKINCEGLEAEIGVMLFSNILDGIGGVSTVKDQSKPEELQRTILGHLCRVQMKIDKSRCASMMLKLGDIMSLAPDDVLVFDNSINDPVEVWIGGRPGFTASLARDNNRFALTIKERM
jgi:flagellar motor switch protein FliM